MPEVIVTVFDAAGASNPFSSFATPAAKTVLALLKLQAASSSVCFLSGGRSVEAWFSHKATGLWFSAAEQPDSSLCHLCFGAALSCPVTQIPP